MEVKVISRAGGGVEQDLEASALIAAGSGDMALFSGRSSSRNGDSRFIERPLVHLRIECDRASLRSGPTPPETVRSRPQISSHTCVQACEFDRVLNFMIWNERIN